MRLAELTHLRDLPCSVVAEPKALELASFEVLVDNVKRVEDRHLMVWCMEVEQVYAVNLKRRKRVLKLLAHRRWMEPDFDRLRRCLERIDFSGDSDWRIVFFEQLSEHDLLSVSVKRGKLARERPASVLPPPYMMAVSSSEVCLRTARKRLRDASSAQRVLIVIVPNTTPTLLAMVIVEP